MIPCARGSYHDVCISSFVITRLGFWYQISKMFFVGVSIKLPCRTKGVRFQTSNLRLFTLQKTELDIVLKRFSPFFLNYIAKHLSFWTFNNINEIELAISWDFVSCRICVQQRIKRDCANAQSHLTIRCSHVYHLDKDLGICNKSSLLGPLDSCACLHNYWC